MAVTMTVTLLCDMTPHTQKLTNILEKLAATIFNSSNLKLEAEGSSKIACTLLLHHTSKQGKLH